MAGWLAGKKTFAFDWDGTLFDSMPVKWRTFSETLAPYLAPLLRTSSPELVTELQARYQALSGAPRREIVETISSERGLAPDAVDFDHFSSRLSEVNRRELARAELFADGLALLERLTTEGRSVYISSSVPQAELSALVQARLPAALARRLRGVFGTDGAFTKGPPHVARMLRETGVEPAEFLFFGDDPADARLCRLAGVDCVLVDRRGRLAGVETGAPTVPDFGALSRESNEVDTP
jgi:phosphoglycolate phosphatase-like HAD superfamily hydrolase